MSDKPLDEKRIRIFRYAYRNEVEVHMNAGESVDAYNAKLAYSRGDIKSTKKMGSLKAMFRRAIADEEMLLRTYAALPAGKGGMVRLYHDKASVAFDTHAIKLPSGHSILLNDDDYLMMADTGLVLKNDFQFKGTWTDADTLKPRLDNPTMDVKRVYVAIPAHETISVPMGDYVLIHPDEFLLALMDRPNSYRISVKLGLMSLNRVMIEVMGPATVYRRVPDISETERINRAVFIQSSPSFEAPSSPPRISRKKSARKNSAKNTNIKR